MNLNVTIIISEKRRKVAENLTSLKISSFVERKKKLKYLDFKL